MNGFRDFADNYLVPDGIDLIVSRRREALRELIKGFAGRGFEAFRTQLRGFLGIGAPPAVGVLTVTKRNEVHRNRAWRDLVERKIPNRADRALVKAELWIPE